ncbi:MAG: methyl-accepting chemotaxis protein [Deltaproteobacteria bacterium]|nr:methyl-accepting chemotaxis protein [Deltaproteobacteria bacterium]
MPIKIKTRLLVCLIPAIFAALVLMTFFSYRNAEMQANSLATTEAQNIALAQAEQIFSKLRKAEASAVSLASSLAELRHAENSGREAMSHVVKGVTMSSPDYFGTWALWESNAFDGNDAEYIDNEDLGNEKGRANAYWTHEEGSYLYEPSDNYDHEHYYTLPKQEKRLIIIPPYRDMDTANKTLMTSLAAPIMEQGQILGVVGIDIELDFIQALINEVAPYETGYAMLISDQGEIIASGLDVMTNATNADLPTVSAELRQKMAGGKSFSTTETAPDGEEMHCFYTPVSLTSFNAPWYFMVALPLDKVMADSRDNLMIQLGISILALLMLVSLVFYTAGSVSNPLKRIAAYAQNVAKGNYNADVDKKGFVAELEDLQTALRSMVDSLLVSMKQTEERNQEAQQEAERARVAMNEAERIRKIIEADQKSMLEVAGRVDAVSQKLQVTSQAVNKTIRSAEQETQKQNALMDETVAAISGMSDSVTRVSENAADAAKFTERGKARAGEGAEVVNNTIKAFESIRREAEALGTQIKDLSGQTESIGNILGLITDVADQTNLLALNAAIEAARAGEAGRGFAVVADEVRKLAEKTMAATKQVEESINGIRGSMQISAQGVTRTIETVNATVTLGHNAQASLSDIVGLITAMSEQIHGIADLCRDQAATSTQINKTVDSLRQLGIMVGNAMNEGATMVSSLEPEARELGRLVEQLSKRS